RSRTGPAVAPCTPGWPISKPPKPKTLATISVRPRRRCSSNDPRDPVMRSPTLPHASGPALALGGKLEAAGGGPSVNRTQPEEDAMTTISEVERPGLAIRAFY